MSKITEKESEPILYELLEYFVKKQEPELIKCKNDTAILPTSGTIKNALRYLNNRYSLPESISQQVSFTLPWKFTLTDHGRLLAVLQENVIEIRKAKDEYSSVIGRALVPKDAFPQWRKITWSPDGTLLILASSYGYISFYNSLGNNIYNITPKSISQNQDVLEAGDAIASMLFLKPRASNEIWSYEFILITYSGLLKSYHVSASNGFKENYEFSFGNFYKNGINAIVYDDKHDLLYVAGNTITQRLTSSASETGLSSWRLLNDYPYCKLSVTFDQSQNENTGFSIWNVLPTFSLKLVSIIFKISVSPNREHLICLHTDGSVSIWSLPNLVLQKKWKLQEQPDFNISNPLGVMKCKNFPSGLTEYHPVDIGWWSDQAVIITRYSGSTSVCSIKNLNNLLGTSPEFLAGQPQISELGLEKGFLCLDCETFITSKKRSRQSSTEGPILETSTDSEIEEDELQPTTILNYTTNLMQSTLYSITDFEKFQPKRKKTKILHRTYRILGLKSTTPEELYTRKIDIEEYEEALTLAKTYNLDTDLVYQTQWRKSEHSVDDIEKHLSKVSKRSWVLNECITRVPNTLEAVRELLNFGLKGANLETLIAINEYDNGKFASIDEYEDLNNLNEGISNYVQAEKINEILKQIDLNNLSEAQKDLIRKRRKLLEHLDKLMTYEIILEPSHVYNKNVYAEFREVSAVENARRFAENGDCRGVEIMFTYHGEKLFPHWLPIISYFPETLNPKYYENLLPKCDSDKEIFLLDQKELRQKDWSESDKFYNVIDYLDNDELSNNLYSLDSSISVYRTKDLTIELLQKWYKSRAYQIERNSFMTDNALELIRIAISHNVDGLESLILDLETLDDLVYKVYLEEMTLDLIEKLSDIEKVKLLMSKMNENNFIESIKTLLLPFIIRNHKYLGGSLKKHLLNEYLTFLSKDNLNLSTKFFEYIAQSQDKDMLEIVDDIIALAVTCIYACNDFNMYQKAKEILDFLPRNKSNDSSLLLEDLEKELQCSKILKKYSVKSTVSDIKNNKNDPEASKLLLTQMARNFANMISTDDEDEWAQLLNEMLEIHGLVFTCIDVEVCFEICVSARLVSGKKKNIQNAAALIETKKNEKSLLKVSYEKAVNLILSASEEYFNSSKSLIDPNMELAKACLYLIADNNAEIKKEYDLINSLQILHEFNIDMLPLKVRLTQDKLKLIQDCLDKREDAYKSKQRLLTLADYLRIEEKSSRIQEGKVLELIAKKAFKVKDYAGCMSVIQQLMKISYIPAWEIISNLGYCNEFEDFHFRQKCLWFAINNGPCEILQNAINQIHLIEIQILNKDLQRWAPQSDSEDFEEFEDDQEDEDNFADAMTTPQAEVKEFVPKVFETSTKIVQTSANIMKQSTFDLIRNVSDTNFWKSRLKILNNFTTLSKTELHYNDDPDETDDKSDLQSFPYFYASLHEKCKISNIYTKYSKCSMPDVLNKKLKYCQSLLRIALLSESSCSGLEVNDINHLLLECAKEILSEDWLLGISYLLALHPQYINDAQAFFMELPRNNLYIQTAAYYYALLLHNKIYPNVANAYLYDPIKLIYKMHMVSQSYEDSELKTYLNYWYSQLISLTNNTGDVALQSSVSNECTFTEEKNIIHKEIPNSNEKLVVDLDETNFSQKNESSKNNVQEEEWTEDWGDFSDEEINQNTSPKEFPIVKNENQILGIESTCKSEEERYIDFQDLFTKLKNKEQYQQIKKLLLTWPNFVKPIHTTANKHPILLLMNVASIYISSEEENFEHLLLHDYKQLIEKLESVQVLKEFLDENNDMSFVHKLYIRLCTNNQLLLEEAIELIKTNYQKLKIPPAILEEIFLKDLTICFDPDHVIYKMVIEHVFINKNLRNIEENGNKLIQKLIDHKHFVHAIIIVNLMEGAPISVDTLENSLQLLRQRFNFHSSVKEIVMHSKE